MVIFGKKSLQLGTKSKGRAMNPLDVVLKKDPPKTKEDISPKQESPSTAPSSNKTSQLIEEMQKIDGQMIKPFVDFVEGNLFYPILSKIGLAQDDIAFLDNLVEEDILEKKMFEKLVVCPNHPTNFSSSVRLYCPKCHSIKVEKLNLYEHKQCGYISDSRNFDFSSDAKKECPSCKKEIKNFERDMRIPARWFECNNCKEKFDNIDIQLYCRKYEHDFDTNSAQFIPTYSYHLKNSDYSISTDLNQMKYELVTMLQGFDLETEINSKVVGKSGNSHEIPICGKNQNKTILVFLVKQDSKLDHVTINSIVVPILDIEPTCTILITRSEVSDDVYAMAKRYNIDIISHFEFSEIMSHAETLLSEICSKMGGNDEK